MNDFIKKLLKSIGLTDAQITIIDGYDALSDEEKAKHPQKAFVDAVTEHTTNLLENDMEFKKRFEKAAEGKILEQVDRRLKQTFGLTEADIAGKKIEEKMQLGKAAVEKQYQKTGDTLQQENATLTAKIKEYDEVTIPAIKATIEEEKAALRNDNALSAMLADPEMRLKVSPAAIMPALKQHLTDKYKLAVNDKGELDIVDKATGLKVKNADGTGFLGSRDIVKSFLTENKVIELSNGGGGEGTPKPIVKVPGTDGTEGAKNYKLSGMSQAEKNLAEMNDGK